MIQQVDDEGIALVHPNQQENDDEDQDAENGNPQANAEGLDQIGKPQEQR